MTPTNVALMLAFLMFAGNLLLFVAFIGKHNNFKENQDHAPPVEENKMLKSPSSSLSSSSDVTSLLWEDMTKSQKGEAYSIVLPYLQNHSKLVNSRQNSGKGRWHLPSYPYSCSADSIGQGWSGHHLCIDLIENLTSCQFFSFGIARAYSFEKVLADKFHCHGFASDPTTQYPSNMHKNITFQQLGANLLYPNEEQDTDSSNQPWWVANVPLLKKTLGVQHLNILKMDCEGCEYALARDIVRDDPTFFDHVDQFAVEIHLAKEWLKDKATVYYYGILIKKLAESGFRLHHTQRASCAPEHTKTGCVVDFLCKDSNRCHNYLFAKV